MKEVERMNAVIMWSQQRTGFAQRNPYTMDIDRRKNRNCYSCGGFRHLARNCRNKRTENRIREGRRLEYGGNERQKRIEEGNREQNLNRKQDLILLD